MKIDQWSARPVAVAASLAALAVCGAGAVQAQDGVQAAPQAAPLSLDQAAAIFGARETVDQASLSPDGKLLATVESNGARGSIVKVVDLSNATSVSAPILASEGDPERLNWCRWSGAQRLLCSIYGVVGLDNGMLTYVTRLVAIDADGKRMQIMRLPQRSAQAMGYTLFGGSVIDWNTGEDGHVLMLREYVPEFSTGTHLAQRERGIAVDDVNTLSLNSGKVENPRTDIVEYITDGHGTVRIVGVDPAINAAGYDSGRVRYSFRTKASRQWQVLGDYDRVSGEGFNPYYVDPALDVAYGLKLVDGRKAAYTVSLDGKGTETLILARPDVDVDDFVTIGRNRRVIGVAYTTDKAQVDYIDPELKRLASALSRGLPHLPLIRFIDSSQDERKLLLWAGSDVDAGHYYLLDRDTRALTEVAYSRAPLIGTTLAEVKAISIKATDGSTIPAYLTLPPGSDGKKLPTLVMPHGGPSARDEWGFDWLAQFWANRGYAVLQPNFRGSSGYGDAWFQNNGFQSWRMAIGDITDSARWLVGQGIADPARLAIFGWSYGGYAALQSSVVDPDLFKAVIAVAPVTDLGRLKEEWAGWSNYQLRRDFIGSGPHIEEGSPARQVDKIKAPVLMFHGALDRNVKVAQSRLMESRLKAAGKPVTLVVQDKLDHYLDDSVVRRDMLLQSANFLDAAFKAGK